MIQYDAISSYFEGLATKYKPIGHTPEAPRFAEMEIQEVISLAKTALDSRTPIMLFIMPEGSMGWRNDKMTDLNRAEFFILQEVGRTNPEKRKQVLKETKEHFRNILVRIQFEKYYLNKNSTSTLYPKFVRSFDLNQVSYNKVGPIFSGCYGWRVEIDLQDDAPAIMTPAQWTDLDV